MKFCGKNDYETKNEVKEEYPSAEVIKRCEGGWMVFETEEEYETWKKQA